MTTPPETTEPYDFTRGAGETLTDTSAKAKHATPDPDLAPVAEKSDLEMIKADLSSTVENKQIVLPMETRPGYSLQFNTDISHEQFEKWRSLAKDRKATTGMDVGRLAALVVANKCTAILKDGKVLTDDAGDPLTFASEEIRGMFSVPRAADAAKLLIGRDSLLTAISDAVVIAAGWGDEVSEVDPTQAD